MSVSTSDLLTAFTRIGVLSFGGPAAQIAVMEEELVHKRAWLTPPEFLRALGFCTVLPGPEAMQLATYAGWRLRGVPGGLIAGLLFVLPGALVMAVLAMLYGTFGQSPWVQAAFTGVKATVLVLVVLALWRLSRKALRGALAWALAVGAFIALFALGIPFPIVLALAALAGMMGLRTNADATEVAPIAWKDTLQRLVLWLGVWWIPLGAVIAFAPALLAELALFFSWLAVISFGGAYALLAYMAQVVVEARGWLSPAQMIDGLGLAETTPGPLILVTQFVGMTAGAAQGMALAAGIVTLWATFAPCFLFVFVGAPYVDRLASMPRLSAALAGVTAAVVGVIANLGLWFALHVIFAQTVPGPMGLTLPVWASVDLTAVALTALAALALPRFGLGPTLLLTAVAGIGAMLLA